MKRYLQRHIRDCKDELRIIDSELRTIDSFSPHTKHLTMYALGRVSKVIVSE